MHLLLFFALFWNLFVASKLENRNVEDVKTVFADLTDGPVQEIMSHLDKNDKEQFSKVSRDIFKFDPREIVLNLPLQHSKAPTQFVCNHLKMRKTLVIDFKEIFYDDQLFHPDSLTMKYLNCLTNIENLQFGQFKDKTRILVGTHFKLSELFPKLQQLQFNIDVRIPLNLIPNDLKTWKIYYRSGSNNDHAKLKEKILQMKHLETLAFFIKDQTIDGESPIVQAIAVLKQLKNFKRLSIEYEGPLNAVSDILSQTNDISYVFDFEAVFHNDIVMIGDLIETLPKTTETLKLDFYKPDDVEKICTALKSFNNLKILVLNQKLGYAKFSCLFQSLPSSLTDLDFKGYLGQTDVNKITLPPNLHSVTLIHSPSKLFQLLANNVPVLNSKFGDPQNLLSIENPFTRVRFLEIHDLFIRFDSWARLFDLLPMEMEKVDFRAALKNENEYHILEQKILSTGKRIKEFNIFAFIHSPRRHINGKYKFDGVQMVKLE